MPLLGKEYLCYTVELQEKRVRKSNVMEPFVTLFSRRGTPARCNLPTYHNPIMYLHANFSKAHTGSLLDYRLQL